MARKSNLPESEFFDNREGQMPEPAAPAPLPTNNISPAENADRNPSTGPQSRAKAPDPFDPAALRLSPDYGASLGVSEVIVSVPVEKPKGDWWVRVHPSEDYSLETAVIELKTENELYLVAPQLWPALADEPTFSPRALFVAMNRQGRVFLWPCRLPGVDGKTPDWITLPLEAVKQAKGAWTRFFWDAGQTRHRIKVAAADWGDPQWPAHSFRELLKLAFKDRYIDSVDHPVLRKLRGEA